MSDNIRFVVGVTCAVICASTIVYLLIHAWRENAQEAAERMRLEEESLTEAETLVLWGVRAYNAAGQWEESPGWTPDRQKIDNALTRWRANGDTGRYRVIRKTILFEVVREDPEIADEE
jgi:hypothetical protein